MSPDGHWLLTYGAYNPEVTDSLPAKVRLWDMSIADPSLQQPTILEENPEYLTGALFSDDGQWVVLLGAIDSPILWRLDGGVEQSQSLVLVGHQGPARSAAFSHDGHWLITGGYDGTVRAWDLTARNPNNSSLFLGTHRYQVVAIAISQDSEFVITGAGGMGGCPDCEAIVWDFSQSDRYVAILQKLIGHTGELQEVLLTSDDRKVITTSDDGTARVWDLQQAGDTQSPVVLRGHQRPITAVSLSENDRWLATGSEDGSVRIWDLTADDPNLSVISLTGHDGRVTAVMFDLDNGTIITTGEDGTIRVWAIQANQLMETACSLVGRNLKQGEWAQYFPNEPYRLICANLPGDVTALVDEANQRAQQGDISGAVAKYQEALTLDPALDIDPAAEARHIYSSVLVGEGNTLARQGDIPGAVAKYQEALVLNPVWDIDPVAEAERLAPQPISYGDVVTGTVTIYQGEGWSFVGTFGDVVTISQYAANDSGLDTYLTLYGPNDYVLTINDDFEGTNSRIDTFFLPETGIYYIWAGSFGDSSGDYQLELKVGETTP